jgi:hypothetical protein
LTTGNVFVTLTKYGGRGRQRQTPTIKEEVQTYWSKKRKDDS